MLTVHQLVAAQPAATARAGAAWRRLATRLAGPTAELDRQLDGLRLAWRGTAAEAATRQLAGLCAELDEAYPTLLGIEQVLAEHAETVSRAQCIVVTAQSYAGCARVAIGADGTTIVDFTGERPDPGDFAEAEQLTADLHRALALAERSDAVSAARLAASTPMAVSAPPPMPVSAPPPGPGPGQRDTAQVTTWWHELSEAQRHWLVEHRPVLVGNLDGVPAADRDLANRVSLATQLADPVGRHRTALLALRARLDAGPVRAYLLGLSTDGRGRAIVALDDPDTADHVVTCIPGLGGNLDHVTEELARIGHLLTAARQAAPDRSTSVIAWLGYDAPDSLAEAAATGSARHAAAALHRFQAGLRHTHQGNASHNTVIGLSYGSTVVGLTGHLAGLVCDDVVLIGSPGVGVEHAGDLGLDPAHVWASTARHDVINAAVDPRTAWHPGTRPGLWFGPSPAGTGFGAHVFTSAPGHGTDPVGAHLAYYDEGNPALTGMADIVVGDFTAVT